ncbi:uncharacterized protein LOC144762992 [Lissotriton helveticus]
MLECEFVPGVRGKGAKRVVSEVRRVAAVEVDEERLDYEDEDEELEEGEVRDDECWGKGGATTGRIGVFQAAHDGAGRIAKGSQKPADARRTERGAPTTLAGCVRGPGAKKVTWIVGHSFVHWASKYAYRQVCGRSLGLRSSHHEVHWWGKSGMRWGDLLPWLTKKVSQLGCPDMLVIHLGENDLVKLSGVSLLHLMQRDLEAMRSNLAGACIVWTEFVPRRIWRGALKPAAIERARRKLNRAMRLFCDAHGIKVLAHVGLRLEEPLLFRDDGVHLSHMGNAYYLMEMRDTISLLWNESIWCR